MEERLKAIVARVSIGGKAKEEFSPFIERMCDSIASYGMGKDNGETFVKFGSFLVPIFKEEGKVVYVEKADRLKVCGDIHADLPSLLRFLERCDFDEDRIVFLGDYIDKGHYGPQVLLLVFFLKAAMPEKVVLLKGNHEKDYACGFLPDVYNFVSKTLGGYNIYDELFAHLPLACVVNSDILFVHGLFPKVDDIGDFLRSVGEDERAENFLVWGDVNLRKEKVLRNSVEMCKDLAFHLKKYTTRIDDMFDAMKAKGIRLLVRGHSLVRKGFHVIKCGSPEESVGYVKEKAVSIHPSKEAPFFVSLHTFAGDGGMTAACMAIDVNSGNYDIFQLTDAVSNEGEDGVAIPIDV